MPFQETIFQQEKSSIEQPLHTNHKHVSKPQNFNNNIDTSSSDTPKDTIACRRRKVNSVHFEDPYDHINLMENTNY